jgi:hypothetical protein
MRNAPILLTLLFGACVLNTSSVESESELLDRDDLVFTASVDDTCVPSAEWCDVPEDCNICSDDDDPPPPSGPSCLVEGVSVDIDSQAANANDADGLVTFCHATSAEGNKWVLITTSIAACKAHEEHEHLPKGGQWDVFPTGGCAD